MIRDSRQRALLFVESNTSGTGRLFVRAAREIGCRPVLMTAAPTKYPFLLEDDAPDVLIVPRTTPDAIDEVERIVRRRVCGDADLFGITSSSEYFVATATALAARFGLPGPDPAATRAARDKAHQRQALAAAGLPVPPFRVAATAEEAAAAARLIGPPVVVKPIDGSGSVGVRACASDGDAGRHARLLLSRADRPEDGRVLVEALIDGPEYSVEIFSGRVIGVTRKHLGSLPHFVESGHDYPGLPREMARALVTTAELGTSALGLSWGPLHWELRLAAGRAYVMEVNPRLAGGFIPELVRHAEGIDLIRATLDLATGRTPDIQPDRRRYASIRFLFASSPGRLRRVTGLDRVRAAPHVVDLAVYRPLGDALSVTGDFRDRIGHVMTCADRLEIAVDAAELARDTIGIEIGESSPVPDEGGAPVGAAEGAA